MNKPDFWQRRSLLVRLLFTTTLAMLLAVGIALFLTARTAATRARTEMSAQFRSEMDTLLLAASAAYKVRDPERLTAFLSEYQHRPGIRSVGFRDVSDTVNLVNDSPVQQTAPDWFVAWIDVHDQQAVQPMTVNDEYVGILSLSLHAMPTINRAWERLSQQLLLLSLASGMSLLGVWLVLRHGLRPLATLAEGSQSLGAGRFTRRLRVHGSPEFRATLEAFNRMAGNIESLLADIQLREENLRVTMRSIGDAMLTTDTEGRVLMMNPVAEALTGWPQAEARGRPVAEVFHIINEDTRQVVESPIDIVLREGRIVGLANHTLLISRDGKELPIADSGAPIRLTEDGETRGVVLVFRDQSEERRMVRALEASERLYSGMVSLVPAGIYQSDANGQIVFANDMALRIAGMSRDDLSLEAWANARHPDDHNRVQDEWLVAVHRKEPLVTAYRYLHADGTVVWAESRAIPLLNEHNEIQGYIGVITDITAERLRTQRIEQLSRLYSALSHVNSAIVHSEDAAELFPRVCQAVVEQGGFSSAWVCLRDENPARLRLAVQQGWSSWEALNSIVSAIRLEGEDSSTNSLAARTVLSGQRVTSNHFAEDARVRPDWRNQTEHNSNARAITAVPLKSQGKVIGTLVLGSSDPDFFDETNLNLVDEIGLDVSFALENLERKHQRRKLEQQLAYNEERLRLSLEVAGIGMYETDLVQNQIKINAIGARLLELGTDETTISVNEFVDRTYKEIGQDQGLKIRENLRHGRETHFSMERPIHLADGSLRWLRSMGGVTDERDEQGQPVRVLGVVIDITAEHLRDEQERLTMAMFNISHEAIIITDAHGTIVMVNPAFSTLTGYAAEEVMGQNARLLQSDQQDAAFYQELSADLQRHGHWQGELWNQRKNGDPYPVLLSIAAVRDNRGILTHYVGQAVDISRQKEFEERISYLAYRDSLTDLPNRALLRDRVKQGLAAAQRDAHTVALLFLDLDHFKNINDSLGHLVGDGLLREVAQRLSASVRDMDTVGRLGGDEFLVMLPGADAEDAARVAQKILAEIVRPIRVESHTLTVTPSIGIALFPRDGGSYDELLKTADTAMYRAKDEGRNAYRFFTPEMNQAVFQRLVLESNLRRAIDLGEFVLFYQPQYAAADRRLIGVEALIRWHQPELGFVSPGQFIPVAEQSGLIEPIGAWVLQEACRQVKAWLDCGWPPLRVAVNFSPRQLVAKNVLETVDRVLAQTGLPGDCLEIEITESLLATDMEHTLAVLLALQKRGIHVAVDDFGTGYSSLSYLKRFPIDRLKIDQSFVRDLDSDPDDRAIAAAIVTMGHSLGMKVIAEGVETAHQLQLLSDMGCDELQGYYLGRPMPASDLKALVEKGFKA